MAITNFIPTIWSENLTTALNRQYIAVANCNREYEGEIRNRGSVVKICGVGKVDVGDYTKNTDMSNPQALSDTVQELTIDQAKYFNFQIDDIDKAQCSPKLLEAAMKVAADSLANEADKYVFSLHTQVEDAISNEDVTENNILDVLLEARQKLYENNVSDASEVVIEVSPAVASLILKAKIDLCSDNNAFLETGCLGSIGGCKVFVSNNMEHELDSGIHYYKCWVRTKRAIAFAEQLSEIDAYRPEKRFADAVKGLHLYGASIVYPKEIVVLDLGIKVA
ncbi:MAG: P22 coat protein - protein 5 domain protein [Clostridia bacterium]|nr:P22 coat protein - protein 5 domain protein [Clostridia bacterium]